MRRLEQAIGPDRRGGEPAEVIQLGKDRAWAAQATARYSWYRLALLDEFYPVPKSKNLRPVPFMPYLNTPKFVGAAPQIRRRRLSRGR